MAQNTELNSDALDFIIEAEEVQKLSVSLVGIVYEIMPPKASTTLKIAAKAMSADKGSKKKGKQSAEDLAALATMVDDWVKMTFSREDASAVLDRLSDPNDLLDVEHIVKLVEKLVEKSALARPTS